MAGKAFTDKMERGPNKGDTHRMKIAKGGHPYPVAVVKDKGNNSTLRNNPGIKHPKGRKRGISG